MDSETASKPTYEELVTLLAERDKIIIELTERIKHLECELAKLKKNSSNSSKPPSSDIVKPPKKKNDKKGKRRRGGQPGHKKHHREEFAPEQIDNYYYYSLDVCPVCNGELAPANEAPRVVQQVEIKDKPIRIDEHCGVAYWCERCKKIHYAPLPPEVEMGGLAGPGLITLIAYMKGSCHASYSTIQAFLKNFAGVNISRGQLCKLVGKASEALSAPYQELLDSLPDETVVNADETGHKKNGDRYWTWCFRAALYVLFKIDKSRGSQVLIEVLGEEFNGVLGCDYFGAYRKYMRLFDITIQFCIAHLIRDLKFLSTLPDADTAAYGKRLLEQVRELFKIIHNREDMTEGAFQKALEAQRDRILDTATTNVPIKKEAQNMAGRFRKHGKAYFQFITTPCIDPTNNIAEQAIRFIVIDRLITQGTRSESGQRWCERIWTVIATCSIQNRNPFDFILEAISASFAGSKPPSLLPSPL